MWIRNKFNQKIYIQFVSETPRKTAAFYSFKDKVFYIKKNTKSDDVVKIIDCFKNNCVYYKEPTKKGNK